MEKINLPFEELFYRLRDHGLSLGLDEYLAFLHALQAGIGLSDRKSLRQLCISLWTKSNEEAQAFDRLFNQALIQFIPPVPLKESITRMEKDDVKSPTTIENNKQNENLPKDLSIGSQPSRDISMQTSEPSEFVQAIRHGKYNADIKRPKYSLLTEYFPVTHRQMKQSWRHLRRTVREGAPVELDINATIEKIGREGYFREPVLLPRRSNRAKILLFIDQDGSMVPFHALSRQLIDTVKRGGLLQQTAVYYFHDYPSKYLYLDSARLEAQNILDVFMSLNTYTSVLIVSDAGAARGEYDRERVLNTNKFVQGLKQYARRFVWLNPLPNNRWPNTTAGEIARFVPMFDMSRSGLDDAIDALQGRYVYGEKLYPWMM